MTSSSETVNPENPFVAWLLAQIDARGWTVQELSRRAHVAGPTLWNVINRKRSAGPAMLRAIAAAFEMPEIYLFSLAGLLTQPIEPTDSRSAEVLSIFADLNEEDQETMLWMARSLREKGREDGRPQTTRKATHPRARKPSQKA